jgi:hypothetical protein
MKGVYRQRVRNSERAVERGNSKRGKITEDRKDRKNLTQSRKEPRSREIF